MSMEDLAGYRLEKAYVLLKEADDAFKQDHFGMSVNRSYYAMFTAARSLLAIKQLDSSKHFRVIALFNQHIIKSGLFPKEFSKFLSRGRNIRERADYGDFVEISKEDAQSQLKDADKFVKEVENSLKTMIKSSKEDENSEI